MAAPVVPSLSALRILRASAYANSIPNSTTTTTTATTLLTSHASHHQTRHATLLRRPKRPYTFTQLITLSDGSSFLHRTTSPTPVYKTTKDIRNTPLWNPSSQKLLNVEDDEAGKLAAFRAKFGTAWDAETGKGKDADHLMDLLGSQGRMAGKQAGAGAGKKALAADATAAPTKPPSPAKK